MPGKSHREPGKSHRPRVLWVLILLCLPLAGCQRFQARVEFNRGNAAFKQELYKEALEHFQKGLKYDPGATFAWRSVGLSAMVLYRPGVEDPENLKMADTTIDALRRYLKEFEGTDDYDPKTEEYLLQTMLNAGKYDDALAFLQERRTKRPNDPQIVPAMVGVLVKSGRLQEALTMAEQATSNEQKAQQLHLIGVTAYEKSSNADLGFEGRAAMVELGIAALEKSDSLVANQSNVLTFWQLLLREKAKSEMTYEKQAEIYAKAEEIYQRALVLIAKERAEAAAQAEAEAAKLAAEALAAPAPAPGTNP